MSRLTNKDIIVNFGRMQGKTLLTNIIRKLSNLEDLEDEINFSAEIVLKALLNGIYCEHEIGERNYYSGTELNISGNHEALVVYENNVYWITRNGERIKQQRTIYKRFEFKDYKKTWFLKGDLSEGTYIMIEDECPICDKEK